MRFPSSYELIEERYLGDVKATGFLLKHKKTGAKVVTIPKENEDNKVFYIAFRTPPKDSTGVPHILEHSVLCGSEKYPVKDPFVELAKGSLNTFLNAMTYPDKTIYPVASCNDKDFQNLMDVYLDAVFHPDIFKHKEIFEQEGWHYELESIEDELTINGVVYNEMKGAFSNPESVLDRTIMNVLFPDTLYSYESGGDPKNIPDLSYEDFLGFYKQYYHPSNAYIYLYGDCDMEEKLDYIDKEYLDKFDSCKIDSEIIKQKPFSELTRVEKNYPISAGENEEDGTYITLNYVVDVADNPEESLAIEVLDYALLSSPGAPVKRALLEAKLGKSIIGGYENGIRQPFFSFGVKKANECDEEKFLEIVKSVLKEQVANGIDKKAIRASLNSMNFTIRESDFGSYPKGLIYGLNMMDSWLYDEKEPFMYLNGLEIVENLKKKVDTDYFEKLVEKYFINNTHGAIVIAKPKKGLATQEEEVQKERNAAKKASMSEEELQAIIDNTILLKEYQQTPSSEEDLAKIPLLTREDLKREARPIDLEEKDIGGVKVLHHNIDTLGIHYLNMLFSVEHIPLEDLGYLSFFSKILGIVDTEDYSFTDFANEVNLQTGGISTMLTVFPKGLEEFTVLFDVRSKFLCENIMAATDLIEQMLLHSDFSDASRLHELVKMERSRVESKLNNSGHVVAALRCSSHFSKASLYKDMTSGIEYYHFIKELEENFDKRCHTLQKKCKELSHSIFRRSNLLVSTTGDDKAFYQLNTYLPRLARHLFTDNYRKSHAELVCIKKNEAFKDASLIQYVARTGDFRKAGFEYTGALKILKVILSYDYLWIKVRIQGGAYGCMNSFDRNGGVMFVSYRDPNLKDTNEVFEKTGDYLREFDANEHEMTKFIVGTFSELDTPLTPIQRGQRGLKAYIYGLTDEDIQKERDEIINATSEDIKKLADLVDSVMEQNHICVVGNEDNIDKNAKMFDTVQQLL